MYELKKDRIITVLLGIFSLVPDQRYRRILVLNWKLNLCLVACNLISLVLSQDSHSL
jgi:hypothetical protein